MLQGAVPLKDTFPKNAIEVDIEEVKMVRAYFATYPENQDDHFHKNAQHSEHPEHEKFAQFKQYYAKKINCVEPPVILHSYIKHGDKLFAIANNHEFRSESGSGGKYARVLLVDETKLSDTNYQPTYHGVKISRVFKRNLQAYQNGGVAEINQAAQICLDTSFNIVIRNIVKKYNLENSVAKLYHVLEHVGESNLLDFTVKHHLQSPEQRDIESLRLCMLVLQSIIPLHRAGFLHRDIKPDNMIYQPNTQHIKVVDFDKPYLVKLAPGQADYIQGPPLGTPGFVAPEIMNQKTPCFNLKTEAYALGMVLYHVIGMPLINKQKLLGDCTKIYGGKVLLYAHSTLMNIRVVEPTNLVHDLTTIADKLAAWDQKKRITPEQALVEFINIALMLPESVLQAYRVIDIIKQSPKSILAMVPKWAEISQQAQPKPTVSNTAPEEDPFSEATPGLYHAYRAAPASPIPDDMSPAEKESANSSMMMVGCT